MFERSFPQVHFFGYCVLTGQFYRAALMVRDYWLFGCTERAIWSVDYDFARWMLPRLLAFRNRQVNPYNSCGTTYRFVATGPRPHRDGPRRVGPWTGPSCPRLPLDYPGCRRRRRRDAQNRAAVPGSQPRTRLAGPEHPEHVDMSKPDTYDLQDLHLDTWMVQVQRNPAEDGLLTITTKNQFGLLLDRRAAGALAEVLQRYVQTGGIAAALDQPKCSVCGKEWNVAPHAILCPSCADEAEYE